jgi:ligand-binding SRPBCC domain-containing protein
MTVIKLETEINAPVGHCFDLARNIDLHQLTTKKTGERAIAGKTSGLIEPGETVTWEAVHFGIRQQLTVTITTMKYPTYFCDEMVKGAFKSMRHQHFFEQVDSNRTVMRDEFMYETPFGIFGAIFNKLVLTNYMTRFLVERNRILKEVAESKSAHGRFE